MGFSDYVELREGEGKAISRRFQCVIEVDPVQGLRDEFYLRKYVIVEVSCLK